MVCHGISADDPWLSQWLFLPLSKISNPVAKNLYSLRVHKNRYLAVVISLTGIPDLAGSFCGVLHSYLTVMRISEEPGFASASPANVISLTWHSVPSNKTRVCFILSVSASESGLSGKQAVAALSYLQLKSARAAVEREAAQSSGTANLVREALQNCRNPATLTGTTGREQSTAPRAFNAMRAGFNISIFPIGN
jgi:hypothetical protein